MRAVFAAILVAMTTASSIAFAEGPAPRAIIFGDSIVQHWPWHSRFFFTENNYLGIGNPGETLKGMLSHFDQDVVQAHPDAVLLVAGTNDVAGNDGPVTDAAIIANFKLMAERASAAHLSIVIGSVLPATRFPWNPGIKPSQRIAALNSKISAWAAASGITYADFWSALALPSGEINPAYSDDGVHPNAAAYAVMGPIAKAAIDKAIGK
ncbi:MAG TPA: GDSL-type esterase/lipase family protein [Rhizomicrobium sp.]|nr:GDSL-type esterase/lipase family protein [Rhizomicrobium sp.]